MNKRTLLPGFLLTGVSALYFGWVLVAFPQHEPLLLFSASVVSVGGFWLISRKLVSSLGAAIVVGLATGVFSSFIAASVAELYLRGAETFLECCLRPNTNYAVMSLCWLYSGVVFVVARPFLTTE